MAFVKLDAGILNSTLWYRRPELEVFITALLMAEPREFAEEVGTLKIRSLDPEDFTVPPGWYGFVPAAGPGIVARAHVPQEDGLAALEQLASPEAESRSQAFGGRRMVRVNGGYLILNYMTYRDRDHTAAERQRRLRERKRVTRDSNTVTRDVTVVSRDSHVTSRIAEAEYREHTNTSRSAKRAGAKAPDRAEEIYELYPRKVSRASGVKAIRKALMTESAEKLIEAVTAYAAAVSKWPRDDLQYVPHAATWFNGACYDDDREAWQRKPRNGSHKPYNDDDRPMPKIHTLLPGESPLGRMFDTIPQK